MSVAQPAEDGSRVEAEAAGDRHEHLDGHPHAPASGHPPEVNADVVRATPPDGRALLVAAAVAALTLLALVLLAVKVS